MKIKPLVSAVAVGALVLLLAGCGRRGPLEPPPYTAQGQALAKQRASQNARRGLAPTANPAAATPEEQAETNKVEQINRQSEAAEEDATPARLRDDPHTGIGEVQMPFATSRDLVQAPAEPAKGEQAGALSPKSSGRKPPPIQRPNKSFVLDPLLE